jgi:hypothetical protein
LAPRFYEKITTRAVPLDFSVLVALRSPLAIDLYAWATDRVFRLHKPVVVAWPALRAKPRKNGLRLRPCPPHIAPRC